MICAQVHDPHEIKLPRIGLTTFEDAETGETITLDLSDRKFHEDFANKSNSQLLDFSKKLKKRGIDFFRFSTNEDFDKNLKEFFHLRKSKRR